MQSMMSEFMRLSVSAGLDKLTKSKYLSAQHEPSSELYEALKVDLIKLEKSAKAVGHGQDGVPASRRDAAAGSANVECERKEDRRGVRAEGSRGSRKGPRAGSQEPSLSSSSHNAPMHVSARVRGGSPRSRRKKDERQARNKDEGLA